MVTKLDYWAVVARVMVAEVDRSRELETFIASDEVRRLIKIRDWIYTAIQRF